LQEPVIGFINDQGGINLRVIVMRKMNILSGAAFVGMFTLSLVVFPREGVQAAMAGLKIFWEVVLPSLLPFFVLSEMMLGMGIVHFIGVLLEPLMRPLFNVPGVGAFALSMGLAAGYPMDAVITGKFRRNGMCSRIEGERLLSFTNTADPLFMFGAVAVGMFCRPELGAVLGITHYLSSFTVGFIFKYYRGDQKEPLAQESRPNPDNIIRRAFRALLKAREDDQRPIGKLMGDAVRESMGTLLMIGGFIMLFSVMVKMLAVFGVIKLIAPIIGAVLNLLGLAPNLASAVFSGILEIDLGTVAAAQANAPLADRVIIAGWIIAWSGLCVHGQVASVIHDTDIRMGPYIVARMLHGIIAAFYTWIFMGPLAPVSQTMARALPVAAKFNPLDRVILSGRQMLFAVGLMLLGGVLAWLSKRFAIVRVKRK
jgi:sporulation integral membrane protein YlbJ